MFFVVDGVIGGGVLKEGILVWVFFELFGVKGEGVILVVDKGVFSGVLGVVGLLVVVLLLLI